MLVCVTNAVEAGRVVYCVSVCCCVLVAVKYAVEPWMLINVTVLAGAVTVPVACGSVLVMTTVLPSRTLVNVTVEYCVGPETVCVG